MEEQTKPLLPNAFALHNGVRTRLTGPDQAEAILEMGTDSLNPYGRLHGGAYYTLADCACGCACRSDGRRHVTLHGGLDFVRSAQGGTVIARARVRHRGRTTCQLAVEISDEAGTLLATGSFTFFCVDQR